MARMTEAEIDAFVAETIAFAIMLGEIPEDTPEPPSPSDPGYDERYGRHEEFPPLNPARPFPEDGKFYG